MRVGAIPLIFFAILILWSTAKASACETSDNLHSGGIEIGLCKLSFDVVFDWARTTTKSDGTTAWIYNTYFFSGDKHWIYINNLGRVEESPYLPFITYIRSEELDRNDSTGWKIDAIVQIRDYELANGPIFIFSGETFIEYNNSEGKFLEADSEGHPYPQKIADAFLGIPPTIDTAIYGMAEKRLFFFKNDKVYRYDWRASRLESVHSISSAFPGWKMLQPLPNNIDAVYFSYTDRSFYFFKGPYYWRLLGRAYSFFDNAAVGPKSLIAQRWKDFCL